MKRSFAVQVTVPIGTTVGQSSDVFQKSSEFAPTTAREPSEAPGSPPMVNVTVRTALTVSRACEPKSSGFGEPVANAKALIVSWTKSPAHPPKSCMFALTEETFPFAATALPPLLQDATSSAPGATTESFVP